MRRSVLSGVLREIPPEAWLILIGAAVLRLVGITNIFPSVDELSSMRRAIAMMTDADLNPHWFWYPTGYYYFLLGLLPLRLVGGVLGSHWIHPHDLHYAYLQDPMVVAPFFRTAGVLVSVLAILFTYLAAKRVVGRRWAWLAGLFLAISPLASYWSTQIWPEALIILPSAICVFYGVVHAETGRLKHILISGLAAGVATSVKYNAAYLCAVIPCAMWVFARGQGVPNARSAWRKAFLAGLAPLLGFLALTPYAVLDWRAFMGTFVGPLTSRQALVSHVGLDAGYALQRTAPWIWWSQALNSISPGFIWIIGFTLLLVLTRWRMKFLVLMAPIVVMLPLLTWFGKAEFRHLVPILPVFGMLLSIAADRAGSFSGKYRWIAGLVACAVCLPGFLKTLARLAGQRLPDTRIEARNWIESNVPDGSRILLDKFYVPHLVRSREQVQYFKENHDARAFDSPPDVAPGTVTYWFENLPVAVHTGEHGMSEVGLVAQPELPTPAEYAAAGFRYAVLSSGTYKRFYDAPQYGQLREYYQSFFAQAEVVREFNGSGHPGPKITILRLRPSTP